MGNRGVLHDEHGRIRREHQLRRWIICRLEFKGRHREIMRPGRWTELFFLDEATALAAGHRPCAECRRSRFNEFRKAWLAGNPEAAEGEGRISAPALDDVLHRERLAAGAKVTFRARVGELPDGVIVAGAGEEVDAPHLLWDGRLWAWGPAGYEERGPSRPAAVVEVLTPRSTVNAVANGFRPDVALPSPS